MPPIVGTGRLRSNDSVGAGEGADNCAFILLYLTSAKIPANPRFVATGSHSYPMRMSVHFRSAVVGTPTSKVWPWNLIRWVSGVVPLYSKGTVLKRIL